MSISPIVTRGFGSFAGTKYVPTRGYLPAPPTPPPIFPVRPAWVDISGSPGSSGVRRLALSHQLNHPQLQHEKRKDALRKEENEIMELLLKIGYDVFFDE